METKQKLFGSFYVFVSLKSNPNNAKNFKSLRVSVHEITKGGVGGGVESGSTLPSV